MGHPGAVPAARPEHPGFPGALPAALGLWLGSEGQEVETGGFPSSPWTCRGVATVRGCRRTRGPCVGWRNLGECGGRVVGDWLLQGLKSSNSGIC